MKKVNEKVRVSKAFDVLKGINDDPEAVPTEEKMYPSHIVALIL
jgi:hypothetical protein